MKCDVSKEEEIVGMFKTIKENHGGVDLCVNNAGLAYDAPLLSGNYDQWKAMLDVCCSKYLINTDSVLKSALLQCWSKETQL